MTLSLNSIKPNKKSVKKRKRIGRGNASGTGTYSGKGLKGQRCRSGVSGLKRLGMKQVLLRTPKLKGFKSLKPKAQTVYFSHLNESFKEGEEVSPKTLVEKAVVKKANIKIKVLGNGELKIKKLSFKNVQFSESAKAKIEKSGGKIS